MNTATLWRIARSRWLLQAVITAAFLALGIWLIDIPEAVSAFGGVDLRWVPFALATFTLGRYVDSWRWRFLLRGILDAPQRVLFAAFLVGNMVNNILPFRAGDLAKIQVLGQRYDVPRPGIAASVFVAEAGLDGAVLVSLLLLSLFLLGPAVLPAPTALVVLAIVAAILAFVAAITISRNVERIARAAGRLPKVGSQAAELIEDMGGGLYALRGAKRTAGAVLLSLPVWLLESTMFGLFGRAFGLELPPAAYVLAMVAANLVTALPITLGNLGTFEAVVGAAIGLAGASSGEAVSFAFTVHIATAVWIWVNGLVALWFLGVRPRELFSLEQQGDAGAPGRETASPDEGRSAEDDDARSADAARG
jgi:uncharacterized protein (TIRG00374 family)